MSVIKSNRPLVFNLISVGLMGLVGLSLNIFILQYYNTEALGLFNFVYALFIVLSQFSTFGLHYSTLKSSSEHFENKNISEKVLTNALVLCAFFSIIVVLFSACLPYIFPSLFKFEFSRESFYLAIPGLVFFSFNKVFLSYINGRFEMERYAFLVSLRYIGMFVTLIYLLLLHKSEMYLSLVLTVPELLLFLICTLLCKSHIKLQSINMEWMRLHYDFSYKSFMAGASIELNSRVDVLILSYFTNEKNVGLYSAALFLIEGVLQIVALFRNMINPYITKYYISKEIEVLKAEMQKTRKKMMLLLTVVFMVITFVLYFYLKFAVSKDNMFDIFYVYLILMSGVFFSSHYLPFQFFPNQIGKPFDQSILNLQILIGNIALNLLFVYFLGLYGAAIATALSFILSMYILRRYIENCLNSSYS